MVDPRNFILTWEDNPSWDDCVPVERIRIIDELTNNSEEKNVCPYLNRLEQRFYYCGSKAALSNLDFTKNPNPFSAQYNAQVDHLELQLWCMASPEEREKCMFFQKAKDKIIEGKQHI
ncbi:hypothetical protein J4407_02725 [Candidatus Pacearchaeota archaeon]|nr:hypothetical protein [Candidatus Pacearchaeota archaeon]